jgi:hypothetical protein
MLTVLVPDGLATARWGPFGLPGGQSRLSAGG